MGRRSSLGGSRGAELELHGWIYGLEDGRLRDLGVPVDGPPTLG